MGTPITYSIFDTDSMSTLDLVKQSLNWLTGWLAANNMNINYVSNVLCIHRIHELEEMNRGLQQEYTHHWQETHSMIQNLRLQLDEQHRAQHENNNVKWAFSDYWGPLTWEQSLVYLEEKKSIK